MVEFFVFHTFPFSDYFLFSFIKNFVFRIIFSKIIKGIAIFRLLQNVRLILWNDVHIYFWYSRIQSTNFKLICSSWLEFEPFVVKLVVHNLGRRFNLRQTITLNPRLWLCTDLNLHYPRSLLFNPWLSAFSFLDTIAVSEDRSTFKIRYLFNT